MIGRQDMNLRLHRWAVQKLIVTYFILEVCLKSFLYGMLFLNNFVSLYYPRI